MNASIVPSCHFIDKQNRWSTMLPAFLKLTLHRLSRRFLAPLSAFALLATPFAESAEAQTTYSWRSEATTGQWNSANNWWNGGTTQLPQGNDVIRFDNNVQPTMTNDLPNTSRYRIFFDSGSGARTIAGGTANTFFDFGGNTPLIQNDSGNEQTINFKVINGNSVGFLDFSANSGNLVFGGDVSASGAGTRQVTVKGPTNTTITISGKVTQESGATLSLYKEGNGTVTLSGGNANDYTGATTVAGGTLKLDKTSGNAIVGNVTVSAGTLLLARSEQVDSGAGDTVTLSGGTIQRVSGVSETFGDLNVTANSILDFSAGTGGTITFTGLNYTPSASLSLQLLNFTQGSSLVFQNTTDMSGLIGTGFTFGGSGGFGSSTFSGSTFTITAIPEPSAYVAAAGLFALFLWPMRRRLLKDAKFLLGLRPTGRA